MSTGTEQRDHEGCHYIPNLLAVRPGDISAARDALRQMGSVRDTTTRIWRSLFNTKHASIASPVGLLDVPDPHEAASFLAHLEEPIQAAPIHGVGFEGHRGFMSGDGPKPAKNPVTAVRKVKLRGVIAVVDSGIVDSRLRPAWMSGDAVLHERADVESVKEIDASHGTFVTSVIRQLAPDHMVSIAAAAPDRGGKLTTSRSGAVNDPPTTELDVMAAIVRLVERHRTNPSEVKALNLSLGATACSEGDVFLLTLSLAMGYWRRHMGRNAPIFAAAGNSPNPRPVYPAAFDCIRGVAAADRKGKQTVWDNRTGVEALPRWWVDDVAPGVRITGLSGKSSSATVWWSGSSFATAVATALSVTGQSFQMDNGLAHWQTSPVDYRQIAGLPFE